MKGVIGALILFVSAGALLKHIGGSAAEDSTTLILFILAAVGVDLATSGMIDVRIEKLREEFRDKLD